jgi:hypothetical protein
MSRRFSSLTLAVLAAVVPLASAPLTARAQPSSTEPTTDAAPGTDTADTDAADVRADYDRAFAALLRHDLATAAALFDSVAQRSTATERRGAARELARYAREASISARSEDATSGRASFVVSSTLASFYAGFVLDDLLQLTSKPASVAAVSGTTFAGLGASLLLTSGRHISEGVATSYTVGILAGLGNGLLWAPVAGIDVEPSCTPEACPDGDVSQLYLGIGLASTIAGGAAGAYLGHHFQPTPAQARFAGLLAFNGISSVGLVEVMLQSDGPHTNTYLAGLGIGLDAGLAAGIALAPHLDWSGARVTYVMLGDAVGALAGGSIALASSTDDEVSSALVLVGLWGGFGATTLLTRHMAPHARYQPATPSVTIAPARIGRDGRGLAVAGTF